jgi:hypothetical protein
MTDAWDKGYNEGQLAFRRYFAKYGPNVQQKDAAQPVRGILRGRVAQRVRV